MRLSSLQARQRSVRDLTLLFFFFSSRRRHTRCSRDWSSDVCSSDLSITARANPGSKLESAWNVHTGDGSVTMSVPGDLQANIDATTNDGRISLGIPEIGRASCRERV